MSKGIVKTERDAGLKFVDVKEPVCAGEKHVLIEVKAASICGTDLHIFDFDAWAQERIKKIPLILGHELAGVVLDIGLNVKNIKVGDRVALESHIFCGKCETCKSGNQHICDNLEILGIDTDGGFTKYIIVPEKILFKVDFDLPYEEMALMEPLGNAVYCSSPDGQLLTGKRVVIMGDGPAGILAALSSKALGAGEVVAIGINPYRMKMLADFGIEAIDVKGKDTIETLAIKIKKVKFDIGLEMSGSAMGLRDLLNLVRKGGRISVFGLIAGEVSLDITNKVIFQGLTINGINGRLIPGTWDLVRKLLKEKKINLQPMITHRFPLSKFKEAFDIMKKRECGKIIFLP